MHHIGDWASHTRGLTFLQLAAYHLLIEAYYTSEKPLPGDVKQICRIIGTATHNETVAVLYILHRFFVHDVTRNCWFHNRCDKEIKSYQERSEQQREKAAKRWATPVIVEQTKKAINSRTVLETQIQAYVPVQPERTPTNGNELMRDAAASAPAFPNHKPVTINTPNTHPFNVENVAAEAASVCVKKGVKVEPENSVLLALLYRGAGIADFAEAAALAAAQGKGFAFAAGVVNNRLSVANNMALEGPRRGLGSTQIDSRLGFYTQRKKSL